MNNEQMQHESKKKKSGSNRLYYAIIAVIAVIVLIILSLTVFFHISEIYVTGNNDVPYSESDIIFASGIETDTNIIMADTSKANDRIVKELPYIDSVEIIKHFPFKVEIRVIPATIIGQIEENGVLLMDKNGKCVDRTESLQKGIPVIRGVQVLSSNSGEKISFGNENTYNDILNLYNAFTEKGIPLADTTVYNVSDSQHLSVTYQNRIVLNLGTGDNLGEKLDYGIQIIEKQKNGNQTGVLNLSRVPSEKQYAYFSPEVLNESQIAPVME